MNDARDVDVGRGGKGEGRGWKGREGEGESEKEREREREREQPNMQRGFASVKNTYTPARVRHTNNNSFTFHSHRLL